MLIRAFQVIILTAMDIGHTALSERRLNRKIHESHQSTCVPTGTLQDEIIAQGWTPNASTDVQSKLRPSGK